MVVKNFRKKANAKSFAMRSRRAGLNASTFKKKKGYGVSVKRK